MKRTGRKILWRTICGSLGRFLSIFFIVALGVGFLAGLFAAAPDIQLTADAYYDDTDTMDLRILSTLGLTDGDAAAVAATEGVQTVMPCVTVDAEITLPTTAAATARIHTLPDDTGEENTAFLNRMVLLDGRLPSAAGECLAIQNQYDKTAVGIGDVYTIGGDVSPASTLTVPSFTVVGIARSAYYLSGEIESSSLGDGRIDRLLYVLPEAIDAGYYTELFVTLTGAAALNTFSDAYTALASDAAERLEALGVTRAAARRQELTDAAEKEWEEGYRAYLQEKDAAEKQLRQAEAEIAAAEKQLADHAEALRAKQAECDEGKAQLQNTRDTLAAKRAEAGARFTAAAAQLEDTRQQLDDAQKTLNSVKEQLDALQEAVKTAEQQAAALQQACASSEAQAAAGAALTEYRQAYDTGFAQWQQNAAAFSAMQQQYTAAAAALEQEKSAAEDQFAAAEREIDAAAAQIAAGEQALAEGQKAWEAGKAQLASSKTAYAAEKEKAESALDDAAKQLEASRREIDAIGEGKWYVLDRSKNMSFVSFNGNVEKVDAIARVFPVFFFLVAALVSLTTMTRLVEEERGQIGTLFSLGYSRRAITANYLLYALIAAVGGSLCGLIIGFWLFPTVIAAAYSILYTLPRTITVFRADIALFAAGVAILCIVAATLGACAGNLRANAAALLQPKAPKIGKRVFLERIPFIWRRLSFTRKVTVRNLLRYKKRFFMTVIGITGCTALLLTGFGLQDAISDIVDIQFTDLYQYDLTVQLQNADSDLPDAVRTARTTDRLRTANISGSILCGEADTEITLIVPEDAKKLSEFIRLRDRASGDAVPLTGTGILLSEKQAKLLGVQSGDTVTLQNTDRDTAQATVDGIVENYVSGYAYLSPALYTALFHEAPAFSTLLAKTDCSRAEDRQALLEQLLADDNVAGASFSAELIDTFSRMFHSIDYIVIVLILAAALLAFVVLYNLTNINIGERQREIATIKVLGFFDREVDAYIYRETAILSLLGTLTGLIAGVFLNSFVVETAEVDMVMFGRKIDASSFLLAAGITLLFSFLVNLAMHRRLKHIDMVESLKSNE